MAKKKQPKSVEVIELSSDSEVGDEPEQLTPEEIKEDKPTPTAPKYEDQPLLKIKGIRYKADLPEDPQKADVKLPAELPVRAKRTPAKSTGSTRHRHVSIEIPLLTSSARREKDKAAIELLGGEDDGDERGDAEGATERSSEVFKTPMEQGRHITFDDSENDEFLTPSEGPQSNPLGLAPPKATDGAKTELDAVKEEQEDEEESDDEAPEAVSSHVAGAQIIKASQAVAKAAKQCVHHESHCV